LIKKGSKVDSKQARKTTTLVAFVLLLFAAWNFYRGRVTVVYALSSVSFSILFAGLLSSMFAIQFHTLWMRVANVLGYINSRILLTLIFYGLFMPYGFVLRLIGRDPLQRRGESKDSYWTPREVTRQPKEKFERLF